MLHAEIVFSRKLSLDEVFLPMGVVEAAVFVIADRIAWEMKK
jgi:hypothetical protein